jgi:hypothetical protein
MHILWQQNLESQKSLLNKKKKIKLYKMIVKNSKLIKKLQKGK